MAKLSKNINFNPASSGMLYILLFVGLLIITYSLIMQRWYLFVGITFFPLALITLLYATKKPMFSFLLFAFTTCYYTALYRYNDIEGLSIIMDIFIAFSLFSIIINEIANRESYSWRDGLNIQTVVHFIWLSYCFLILLTPYAIFQNLIDTRSLYFTLPLTYIIAGIILCCPKHLRITIILLGIYVITAVFKAYWQKRRGFDDREMNFLMNNGAWHTHLLRTGIRYFSFFTDAGNFGACMGLFTITFGIIATAVKKNIYRVCCLGVTVAAFGGMMLSGTRGAIVVPFAGAVLFFLISKNVKIMVITLIVGVVTYCFFTFTDIGEGNSFIRRMRTAFRPTEDASFSVRLENQKRFAYYLDDKPFGVGVGGKIVDTRKIKNLQEDFIPTDSYYVGIWVEGGVVGLFLYISLQVLILLRCCYLLMFKIKNKQLARILAALLCGVFGLWVNGYVGRAMGFQPGAFLTAIFLAFILNGLRIEQALKKNEIIL